MSNTTQKMKTALLHYLRFKRQAFVATEVEYGLGPADILFIPKRESKVYEIECKISKEDFLNEWRKKEHKHNYLIPNNNLKINYFYFCVPKELSEFALEQILQRNLPYGLMIFEEKWVKYSNRKNSKLEFEKSISILRNAKNLIPMKENKYLKELKEKISLRAMCELAVMYKEKNYSVLKSKNVYKESLTN
jgi:hypothetical protein